MVCMYGLIKKGTYLLDQTCAVQTWLKAAICYTNYTVVVVKRVCSSYNPAPTAGLIPEAQENSHFHATGARKRNLSFSKYIF